MNRKRILAFSNSIFFLSFLVWAITLCLSEKAFGQSQTFTTSGPFTVPHKITSLQVDLWGGGGGGGYNISGGRPAAGGGGSGFTRSNSFAVTPSSSITVTIGIGGIGGANAITSTVGGNTSFGTITANGGGRGNGTTGGIGGGGSGGSYSFTGGNSPNSAGSNNGGGNGGGGSGNPTGGGGAGSSNSSGTGGAGGTSSGGGPGGPGGNNNISGVAGNPPPGGGGGGEGGEGTQGGSGARGEARITWTCSISLTSGAGSNNPTVCLGTGIGPITYVIEGGYGATVTGLPAGVSANYVNGDLTISGIPSVSGTFPYTITPTGSCTGSTASGTITVSAPPAISTQSTAAQTQCIGNAFSPISVTASGNGISYQWYSNTTASTSGGSIVGTNSNTYTPLSSVAGTLYYYVVVTGACSPTATSSISGAFIVNPNNTVTAASSTPILCINTLLTAITHTTTNATSIGVATGLPAGVTASFASNTITISGTPVASGTFNYSIPLIGCGGVSATGTITVTPNNTAGTISSNTFCASSAFSGVTQSTTGATGIGVASNLPPGVTVAWATNTITFSGTPTVPGTYNYSIPLTGGCGAINATGTITINALPVITSPSPAAQTRCIGVAFASISVAATGTGLSYQWYSNTTPSNSGGTLISGATSPSYIPSAATAGTTYYYAVVSGTCTPAVTSVVSGAFLVNPNNTVTAASATPTVCIGVAMPIPVTHTTTGATGIGIVTGLPIGVTASFGSNTITISGTPTVSGVFNYTVPLTGGCGTFSTAGTITVNAVPAIITPSLAAQSRCINTTAFTALSVATRTGFNYQWYSNTANSNSGGTLIGGATTESYLPPNNAAGTTYYYVVVSSPTSCGVAVSSAASGAITVNPLPVVSFTAQPSGTPCVDTDLTYSTQAGETAYVWTIPGVLNTDYIITSGGNGSANLVLRWLTPGSKSVTVNYTDAQGCGATSAATSNTITVQKNTVTPPSNPSSCYTGAFTSITHTTTFATGIANAGVSGGNGLPLGLSATWLGGSITISGSVSPTVTPGPYSYNIPLTGGCGTVAATGIINVEPEYTMTSISSVSPSNTGGSATITLNLIPSTLATGSFVVNYSMGLANPRAATNVTVNFTNGVGTFFTSSITNENLTSLTINSVRKDSDPTSCPVPITANNITFFGIQPKIYISNGTFFVPAGIFQITVKVYGGGGGGERGSNGAGGGGGGYSERTISVVPGEPIGIFIGTGGAGQTSGTPAGNGGTSWATRDSSPPNLPTTGFAFAYGGIRANLGTPGSGGVGQTTNGNIGNNPTGSAGGQGGKGGGVDGGGGGAGGISGNAAANRGKPGIPFGGGGGGSINDRDGGPGASGYVIITYPLPPVSSCFKVIDDGSVSGTAIIEFTCNTSWTAPEGLTGFRTTIGGAGGGGGQGSGSGGGGAGQLVHNLTYSTTNPYGLPAGTSFTITVGQGGAGSSFISDRGFVGGTSSISGSIDGSAISANAVGGGGGGSRGNALGMNGSSGGGGAAIPTPETNFAGGAGTPSRGSSGGRGDASGQGAHAGGGGGGIGTLGLNGQGAGAGQGKGGDGGHGVQYTIAGFLRNYGGGGGGIGNAFNGVNKFNGEGGKVRDVNGNILNVKIGGDGNQDDANSIGFQGQDLTGSGGGSGFFRGGKGGNGIVYIYYDNFRILPVEFLYFNISYIESNRSGKLSWATAKEWENSHFEIERSVNGVTSWTKIGEMEGQGYSEIPTEYSFTDSKLPASGGIAYYRLKQVDFDGKFSYSVTRSIKLEGMKGKGAWIAYPNPSLNKNIVTVDLLNRSVYKDEAILIQISDARGISETFTVNQIESVSEVVNRYLDRSNQGIYILQLLWGNNAQQMKLLRE